MGKILSQRRDNIKGMRIGAPLRISYFRVGVTFLALSLVVSFVAHRVVAVVVTEAFLSSREIDYTVDGLVPIFEVLIVTLRLAGIAFLLATRIVPEGLKRSC